MSFFDMVASKSLEAKYHFLSLQISKIDFSNILHRKNNDISIGKQEYYIPRIVQMYSGQVRENTNVTRSITGAVHSNCPCFR